MNHLLWTLARGGLRALAATWRFDARGGEQLDGLRPGQGPVVWALWHGDFLPLLWLHRGEGMTLLISRHRDGGHLARLAEHWGYGTLRGSSSRGGPVALLGLIRALRQGRQVAIAADGPRGPRGNVKPGVVAAALHTGAPIVPVAASARSGRRLPSWDHFLIPAPGARVRVAYGAPVRFPPGRRRDLGVAMAQVQERLQEVARLASSR